MSNLFDTIIQWLLAQALSEECICVCSRIDSDRLLANEVLTAYLGQVSGQKVLTGKVSLGDGEQIDCAIFYLIYGNVGIPKRLDFTATGPAVGLAARLESLTRQLNRPLLATKAFANLCATKASRYPHIACAVSMRL